MKARLLADNNNIDEYEHCTIHKRAFEANMSNDKEEVTQNFRSNYYQKLGSTTTSAVDEKKNLRKLLNITPLDIRKLQQFCQHLHVPNDFRLELWKILLSKSKEILLIL